MRWTRTSERQAGNDENRNGATVADSIDGAGLLRFSVWLGVVTWMSEYAILLFWKFGRHQRYVWSIESMWLAAVVYVALFVVSGGVLAALVRSGGCRPRTAASLLIGLALVAVLLVFDGIHPLAVIVLATGLAYRLGPAVSRPDSIVNRTVRRTIGPLSAATALIVVLLVVREPIREWRAYSALPDFEPGTPNVILLILDTVRSADLGVYGYGMETTPSLEALARHSVTFDRAMSTAPWTLPSHFSMLTGLYSHEMPANLEDMVEPGVGPRWTHLSEVFADHGYSTAGFLANMSFLLDEQGLDRGFIHWDDHVPSLGQAAISTAIGRTILNNGRFRALVQWHDIPIRKPASNVNRAMLDWIDRHDDRPFFVLANYFDTHVPYLAPAEFQDRFITRKPTAPLYYRPNYVGWWSKSGHSQQEFEAQRKAYDATIASLDNELGRLFDGLRSRGLTDNTLVVLASDHGEAFGEHGSLGHRGPEVYAELLHVPLMIHFPGRIPEGVRVTRTVTLADLPATILDLVDIDGYGIPGRSLASAWDTAGSPVHPSPVIAQANPGPGKQTMMVGDWQYIRAPAGDEELYNVSSDPLEQTDLSGDPAHADRLQVLRTMLDSLLAIPAEERSAAQARRRFDR